MILASTLATWISIGGLALTSFVQPFDHRSASGQLKNPSTLSIAQATPSTQALQQAVHAQINQYRTGRGLPPLRLDARISQQALVHSQAMASGQVPFSHNGFQQRVQAIARTITYSSAAENVAYNQGYKKPDQQAVQGWLKSPGHLKNIQGQFDLTGIGVARNAKGEYYFTQIFIRTAGP